MTLPLPLPLLFFDLPSPLPIRIFRDDGKRASSAIEVAGQDASPLKGVWGKQVGKVGIFKIFRVQGDPKNQENRFFGSKKISEKIISRIS